MIIEVGKAKGEEEVLDGKCDFVRGREVVNTNWRGWKLDTINKLSYAICQERTHTPKRKNAKEKYPPDDKFVKECQIFNILIFFKSWMDDCSAIFQEKAKKTQEYDKHD
jgi:hypothetical protein